MQLDFVSYLLFMIIGMTVGAVLGVAFMRRCNRSESAEKRCWLGTALTALIAILGASR